jgi:hypothetical protein
MAVVTTKSPSIVNLDASPIFIPTIGEGAEGPLRMANDSVASASGDSIGSIYRCVRVPTNAKVKRLTYSTTTAAAGAGAGDIDVAFSDSLTDGTQFALSQLANPVVQTSGPADNKLFGAASTLITTSATHPPLIDATFQGTFTFAHQNLPLWQVLVNLGCTQFLSDPGGFFDIVFKLTTAITVAGGNVNVMVDFVE